MCLGIPPLEVKIMVESNPLKSRILVRRLAVAVGGHSVSLRVALDGEVGCAHTRAHYKSHVHMHVSMHDFGHTRRLLMSTCNQPLAHEYMSVVANSSGGSNSVRMDSVRTVSVCESQPMWLKRQPKSVTVYTGREDGRHIEKRRWFEPRNSRSAFKGWRLLI